MRSRHQIVAAITAVLALTAATTAEARQGSIRARGANGVVAGTTGAKGSAVRARGAVRNDDGSVTAASGGAFRGANGSKGYRASTTTAAPDGSATRAGQLSASGARGSVDSAGSFSRGADGTWSGSRSTDAHNAATGTSYSGTTAIDPATGKPVHTGTCTDASGVAIACR
jgi:hypothetical protein